MSLKYVVRFYPDRGPLRGRFLYLGKEGKAIDSLRGARRFDSEEEARAQLIQDLPNLDASVQPKSSLLPISLLHALGTVSIVMDYKTVNE